MNKSKDETAKMLRLLQKIARYLSNEDLRIQAVLKYQHKAGEFISGLFLVKENVPLSLRKVVSQENPIFSYKRNLVIHMLNILFMKSYVIPGKTLIFLKSWWLVIDPKSCFPRKSHIFS